MAILINGNGNKAIWAAQDADLIAAICGNVTSIAAVGNQFAATQEDASTIGLADGVIITKEGRRIQLDTGAVDLFTIPTGTAGVTSYYIIGYKLTQQSDTSQICETFVQKMNSSSETIDEDTFKGGATEVYVSCYRVTQDGLNIDTIEGLLPLMGNISGGGGGMQKNYIFTSGAHITVDISNLDDSDTVTFSAYYALTNAYARGSRVTISTVKGWTTSHKVLNVTGSSDAAYAVFAQYSDGKLDIWSAATGDSAGACIGTFTIND